MRRTMFKSKIHRATVTQADLDYEGSVTIDRNLLEASDILPHEWVSIWNVTNGERIQTVLEHHRLEIRFDWNRIKLENSHYFFPQKQCCQPMNLCSP